MAGPGAFDVCELDGRFDGFYRPFGPPRLASLAPGGAWPPSAGPGRPWWWTRGLVDPVNP